MKSILVATLLALQVSLQASESWLTDLDEAKTQAKAEGKDLLIDFNGSDWCGACIILHRNVFSKDEFTALASPHFVLVTIDKPARKKLPPERMKKVENWVESFGITRWPTTLLMDADGTVYANHSTSGQNETPESYWQPINSSRETYHQIREQWVTAIAGPEPDRPLACAGVLSQLPLELVYSAAKPFLKQLAEIDPSDSTAYLKTQKDRAALRQLEATIRETESFSEAAAWIDEQQPLGINLAMALRYRLTDELLSDSYIKAKASAAELIKALRTPGPYDQPEILAFASAHGLEDLARLAEAASPDPKLAKQHRDWLLLAATLPNDTFLDGCGLGPKPTAKLKVKLQKPFTDSLLDETRDLDPKQRAELLASSINGLDLYAYPSAKKVVITVHQNDPEKAYLTLDKTYQGDHWLKQ